MRAITVGLVLWAALSASTVAQQRAPGAALDTAAIYNIGSHAGRVWFATEKCGGEIGASMRAAGMVAQGTDAATFRLGFEFGVRDSEDNHAKNGRKIGCDTTRMLYGPDGLNVKGAWVPPSSR